MWQITVKMGRGKGGSWPVGPEGLALGRSATSDIVIEDPMVSRRHCRIFVKDGEVHLKDLDSSNTTLLNGEPVAFSVLKMGDEISIGNTTFIVTRGPGERVFPPPPETEECKTVTISAEDTVYLKDGLNAALVEGRPKTLRDLTLLFTLSRNMSMAPTYSEVIDILAQGLRERLRPGVMWLGRLSEKGGELEVSCLPGAREEAPGRSHLKLMKGVIEQNSGILAPPRSMAGENRFSAAVMAAPMRVMGIPLGAMAVQAAALSAVYDDADLEFLVSLAQVAAPFLDAAERAQRLQTRLEGLKSRLSAESRLIGDSPEMGRVREQIRMAAAAELKTLILGETGTGKELAARAIHDASERAAGPFVVINCAAIPAELFESELFGHEKGAYTGAVGVKVGRFEQADGGTLFLDEVGDLSPANQARILRVLEDGVFYRIGAVKETRVDVRIVAATNKNLLDAVRSGAFRTDLYHRLNAIEIVMPSLRERPSDIVQLAMYFFEAYRDRLTQTPRGFTDAALDSLRRREWKGNVRELRNTAERAMVMASGEYIKPEHLSLQAGSASEAEPSWRRSLADVEKEHIERVVRGCRGNISAAARMLDIHRNTLRSKMDQYGISG